MVLVAAVADVLVHVGFSPPMCMPTRDRFGFSLSSGRPFGSTRTIVKATQVTILPVLALIDELSPA